VKLEMELFSSQSRKWRDKRTDSFGNI